MDEFKIMIEEIKDIETHGHHANEHTAAPKVAALLEHMRSETMCIRYRLCNKKSLCNSNIFIFANH